MKQLVFIPLFLFVLSSFAVFAQTEPDTTTYDGLSAYYETLSYEGKLPEALRISEKLINISREEFGEHSMEYIYSLYSKGNILNEMYDLQNALETLEGAKNLAEQHGFSGTYNHGLILRSLGMCLKFLRRYDEALQVLEAARNCFTEEDIMSKDLLLGIGSINMNMGNMSYAEQILMECINWCRNYLAATSQENNGTLNAQQLEVQGILADCVNSLGSLYFNIQQLHKAQPLFEEAMLLSKQMYGPESYEYLAIKSNLALVYGRLGQTQRATEMLFQLYENHKAQYGRYDIRTLQMLYNLSSSYKALGKKEEVYLDTALQYTSQLLDDFEKSEYTGHPGKTFGYYVLGLTYEIKGQYQEAISAFQQVLEFYNDSYPSLYFDVLSAMGRCYLRMGDYKAFLELMTDVGKNMNEEFKQNTLAYTSFLRLKATAYELNNEPEKSLKEVDRIAQSLEQKFQEEFNYFNEKDIQFLAWDYERLKRYIQAFDLRAPDTLNTDAYAANINLRFKSISLSKRKQLLTAIRNSPDPEIKKQYKEWSALLQHLAELQADAPEQHQSLIDSLETIANDLETILNRKSQDFRAARQLISWQDIQSQLKEGEAFLDFNNFRSFYFQCNCDSLKYVAYLITSNSISPKTIFLGEGYEYTNYKSLRNLYAFTPRDTLANLHENIYKPLAPHLEGIHTIYFSPSGSIHRFNVGAIPVDETQTMADRFQLYQYINPNDFYFEKSAKDYPITDALIFGGIQYESDTMAVASNETTMISNPNDPDNGLGNTYRSFRGENWQYLEWTEKEANEIAATIEKREGKATILKGKEATEEAFKKIGADTPSPRVLHLATHGYFFPAPENVENDTLLTGFEASKNPLIRSGIILAGANDSWTGKASNNDQEDGILTAYEISQMDLSNTELVVLSACETGLGDIDLNEGVMGLQRAFKMAGVKYVLMSLWNVKDKKTYEFMTMFYEKWLGGQEIPEAYQTTQSAMCQKYAAPFNPKNWAGFILTQ